MYGRTLFPCLWSCSMPEEAPFHALRRAFCPGESPGAWLPAMDLREELRALVMTAALPGMDAGGLELSIADNVLTIRGQKKVESETKDGQSHVLERARGTFRRSLVLSAPVDEDRSTALGVSPAATLPTNSSRRISVNLAFL